MNTLTLATNTSVRLRVYNFHTLDNSAAAQLVVTKKEAHDRVFSVFIRFVGIVDEQNVWQISINKDDKEDIPWNRFLTYTGSRSFSFKVVDLKYVKIKAYDRYEKQESVVNLSSSSLIVLKHVPPPSIHRLIALAKAFPTHRYKEIFFTESIVIMALSRTTYKVYVGDVNSATFTKCLADYSIKGHPCMLGLDVEFKGQTHLLEIFPAFGGAIVTEADLKWDGQRIYKV